MSRPITTHEICELFANMHFVHVLENEYQGNIPLERLQDAVEGFLSLIPSLRDDIDPEQLIKNYQRFSGYPSEDVLSF